MLIVSSTCLTFTHTGIRAKNAWSYPIQAYNQYSNQGQRMRVMGLMDVSLPVFIVILTMQTSSQPCMNMLVTS